MSAAVAVLALTVLTAAPDAPPPPAEERVELLPPTPGSPLAAGAAVLPGLLLHGSGHFVLGEREAARNLLATQGVGVASFVAGFALLASTGAANQLAPLYVIPTIGGLGAISVSWLGDLAGSIHGSEGFPTSGWRPAAGLYLSGGYDGLFASKLDFQHGMSLRLDWRGERLRFSPWGSWHPQGSSHAAAGALLGLQLARPNPETVTALDLILGVAHQRFPGDGFHVTTGELYLEGRVDLGFIARSLRNAWGLARLGWGIDAYGYDGADALLDDGLPLLVLDIGMGLQLFERAGFEIVYRQRKNELPGGLMISSGLAGFIGMVQLEGRITLAEGWALLPSVRLGTGVRTTLAVEARLW
ncbi:MAG: hypothetical protein ACOX6T_06665 [Myxococcales bacterium]|jgi:hypothetical protein